MRPGRGGRDVAALPLATALLCLLPASWSLAADPVTLLPKNTIVCLNVANPEKLAALPDHPVVKAVKPGRLGEIFDKVLEKLKEGKHHKVWEAECSLTPAEVLRRFSGAMAFGVFDAKSKKRDSSEDGQVVETGIALNFEGDEKLVAGILRAIAKIEADEDGTGEDASDFGKLFQAKEETAEASGVTLHIHKPDSLKDETIESLAWCVRDKMLIAASGEKPLRAMLERAEAGKTEGTFAGTKTWKSARKETADPELLVTFDFATIIGLATGDGDVVLKAILGPFEFEKIETAAFGLRTDDKAIEFRAAAICDSLPWFFDLFKRAPGADFPAFLPPDLTAASWAPLDLDAFAETVLKKVPEVWPAAKDQIKGGIGALNAMAGVDIEKEFLQQLGTGYFQVSKNFESYTREDIESEIPSGPFDIIAPDKDGAVTGIGLKDPKIVDTFLRTLAEKVGKGKVELDAREYMGWKLHRLILPSAQPAEEEEEEEISASFTASGPKSMPVYFGIAGDWLLLSVGRQELVEKILAGLKSPPADHFWSRPDVRRGLNAIPGGESYARCQDLKEIGPVVAAGLFEMATMIPGMEFLGEMDRDFPSLLKGAEFPLCTFEKYHIGDHTVTSIARIVVSPPAE